MEYVVYILRCADGTLYTGMTNDLPRRLARTTAAPAPNIPGPAAGFAFLSGALREPERGAAPGSGD